MRAFDGYLARDGSAYGGAGTTAGRRATRLNCVSLQIRSQMLTAALRLKVNSPYINQSIWEDDYRAIETKDLIMSSAMRDMRGKQRISKIQEFGQPLQYGLWIFSGISGSCSCRCGLDIGGCRTDTDASIGKVLEWVFASLSLNCTIATEEHVQVLAPIITHSAGQSLCDIPVSHQLYRISIPNRIPRKPR